MAGSGSWDWWDEASKALEYQQIRVWSGGDNGVWYPQCSHVGFLKLLSLPRIAVCWFFAQKSDVKKALGHDEWEESTPLSQRPYFQGGKVLWHRLFAIVIPSIPVLSGIYQNFLCIHYLDDLLCCLKKGKRAGASHRDPLHSPRQGQNPGINSWARNQSPNLSAEGSLCLRCKSFIVDQYLLLRGLRKNSQVLLVVRPK